MKKWQKYLAAALLLFGGCTGQSSREIPAVRGFDAERYMGKWYEYARLPNWFERGMSEVTAEYSMGSSGVITVKNSIKRHEKQHYASFGAKTENCHIFSK